MWTNIKIRPRPALNRERQAVATRFAGNSEVDAGAPPFHAVRRNPAPTRPELREQMCQLVAQGLVNLARSMRRQAPVEKDAPGPTVGAPGGGPEPRRPLHPHARRQLPGAETEEQVARDRFQRRIAAGGFFGNGLRERKLPLAK